MAIPGPPPPPMGGLKLSSMAPPKASAGPDSRSALLQSIQKGAKLKKTVTVDKSAPVISGKVTSANAASKTLPRPAAPASAVSLATDQPKLGGIFEGLSSMPKLKPVGGRCKYCCKESQVEVADLEIRLQLSVAELRRQAMHQPAKPPTPRSWMAAQAISMPNCQNIWL